MIVFRDYKKFRIDSLNIVDPDDLPCNIMLRVFGEMRVLRRTRDNKIVILLPSSSKRKPNWKTDYSERVYSLRSDSYKKSKIKPWTDCNVLYFYSPNSALNFLERIDQLSFDEFSKNPGDYDFLDSKRRIIISR